MICGLRYINGYFSGAFYLLFFLLFEQLVPYKGKPFTVRRP